MYNLLLRLMLLSTLAHLGLSISDFVTCHSSQCTNKLDNATKQILHINWKPISVWPEEAKRFR